MDRRSVQVRISGRVQGVGFRAWTARRARELGLSGWVRNRSDGDVEAVFAGPAPIVATMIEDCRRGPRHAQVDAVAVIGPGADAGDGFSVVNDF